MDLTQARERPRIRRALDSFAGKTRRFLVVTTVFGVIVAVLDTVALLWLGIPLAILWGLLSFVTNYIPSIGFILGVIFGSLKSCRDEFLLHTWRS